MSDLKGKGKIIAKEIEKTFEDKSYTLGFVELSHFMVRIYRTSKNKEILNPVIEKFLIEKDDLIKDLNNSNNKNYIKKRSKKFLKELKTEKGIKKRKRAELFKNRKEFLFYYHIIRHLYFWQVFGINKSDLKKYFQKGIKFLKKFSKNEEFNNFFFNKDMIKYFGTQLVNCVYYLKFLKISNIEREFIKKFREVFPDEKDNKLPKHLYKNKVYGLTHFIIAGSNYYQKYIETGKFDWVLAYLKIT